jgi:hypothetical protein
MGRAYSIHADVGTHNMGPRDREAIRGIFTRDKPGAADPAVADAELPDGVTASTGTFST